jgi:hypothetical protein
MLCTDGFEMSKMSLCRLLLLLLLRLLEKRASTSLALTLERLTRSRLTLRFRELAVDRMILLVVPLVLRARPLRALLGAWRSWVFTLFLRLVEGWPLDRVTLLSLVRLRLVVVLRSLSMLALRFRPRPSGPPAVEDACPRRAPERTGVSIGLLFTTSKVCEEAKLSMELTE